MAEIRFSARRGVDLVPSHRVAVCILSPHVLTVEHLGAGRPPGTTPASAHREGEAAPGPRSWRSRSRLPGPAWTLPPRPKPTHRPWPAGYTAHAFSEAVSARRWSCIPISRQSDRQDGRLRGWSPRSRADLGGFSARRAYSAVSVAIGISGCADRPAHLHAHRGDAFSPTTIRVPHIPVRRSFLGVMYRRSQV